MKVLKINEVSFSALKELEVCSLQAKPDPNSYLARALVKEPNARPFGWQKLSGMPWWVGYGAIGVDYFNKTKSGMYAQIGPDTTWTQEQADERLIKDLVDIGDKIYVMLSPNARDALNNNQFAVLVSFAKSMGLGALRNSNLIRIINDCKFDLVPDDLNRWTMLKGKRVDDLVKRRTQEIRLFLTPEV